MFRFAYIRLSEMENKTTMRYDLIPISESLILIILSHINSFSDIGIGTSAFFWLVFV